jgi:glycosyltransferase involved in cell wall biosynthesis
MQVAKIDVLIPAYNAERTLVSALRSIQDQTVADIRLIVVNDGSTDRTGDLLREIAAADPRVVAIDTPNRGIVGALNLALEQATAPIIARHDADDLAFPDRFARQLAYLDAHPDCIAVGGDAFHIDDTGRRTGWSTTFAGDAKHDADAIPALEPYLMHPFLMLRRDALVAVGGYRYVLHAEDSDLYWRLLGQGRLYTLPGAMGEYRVHAASVTSASVHNGRVGSVYAELGALSYRRCRAGLADISFPQEAVEETRRCRTVEDILAYVGDPLTPEERARLRLSVAAKLLLNATYRPYLLEVEDCALIAAATPELRARLNRKERIELARARAIVMWRLMRGGRKDALRALRLFPSDYKEIAGVVGRLIKAHVQRLAPKRRSGASAETDRYIGA